MLDGFSLAIAQRGITSAWEETIVAASEGDPQLVWLVKAVISVESGWNPNAVGDQDKPNPSYGLMQVTLPTARIFWPGLSVGQLMDPPTNIEVGTAYLRDQVRLRATLGEAISAYNAGRPISGNRAYVNDVLTYYVFFLNADTGEQLTPEEAGGGASEPAAPGPAGSGAGVGVLAVMLWLVLRR